MRYFEKVMMNVKKTKECLAGVTVWGMIHLQNITVSAKSNNDISFLEKKPSGEKDAFGELTKTVEGLGASFYNLVMTVGVIGLIACIIFAGLQLSSKNSSKREDGKSWILYISLGGIVIFGSMAILGLLKTIGGNITNTV